VLNGQIGRGASATVHKVTWLGKGFAEKCFRGQQNETIRKEASLLAGLSHPNILPLFCYAIGDHCCSLVMELMDEDLHSLMMKRLGNEETLGTPFKLLEAVDIIL
jgi:serine/threonine protein kinase